MQLETEEYMTIERVNAVRERAGKLRRQFLKYKDAEIVYSLTHRKLLEMADEAGAIYRIDGTDLINRDIRLRFLMMTRWMNLWKVLKPMACYRRF